MKSAAPKLSWSMTSKLKTESGSSQGNSKRSNHTGVKFFFFTEPFSLFPSTDICGNGSADAGPLENIFLSTARSSLARMTVTRRTFGGLSTCARTTPGVVRRPRNRRRDSTRRDALSFDRASSVPHTRRRPSSRSPRPFPAGVFVRAPSRLSTGRRTSPW